MSATRVGHLHLSCSGLDRMREAGHDPASKLTERPFSSFTELFTDHCETPRDGIRPCRICALEPVLSDAVTGSAAPGSAVTFVVTSLGSKPVNRRAAQFIADQHSEEGDAARARAEAASARAERIAEAAGLNHVTTSHGVVLYGFLPTRTVDLLEVYVEVDRPAVSESDPGPTPDVVAGYWSLVKDSRVPHAELWTTANDVWGPVP